MVSLQGNCIFKRRSPDGGSYIIRGAALKMISKALMGPLRLVSEMVVLRKMERDPSASSGFPIHHLSTTHPKYCDLTVNCELINSFS